MPQKKFKTKIIKSWKGLLGYYYKTFSKEKWLFRGDNPDRGDNLRKAFKSSLDKAFNDFNDFKIEKKKSGIERALIRRFRRKEHLYTNNKSANWLECLAIMQHHGAPTRLLDWMYSFFAAVYFAINRATKGSCVVWALNNNWIGNENYEFEKIVRGIEFEKHFKAEGICIKGEEKLVEELKREFLKRNREKFKGYIKREMQKLDQAMHKNNGHFDELIKLHRKFLIHKVISVKPNWIENQAIHYLMDHPRPFVYAVNPYYLNERLSIQQGVLLCSGNIKQSWGGNLDKMLKDNKNLCKIEIRWDKDKPTLQKQILKELSQMNINQATLFPDLDGFAESLRTRIANPEIFGID